MQIAVVVSTKGERAEVDASLGGPCGECEERGSCALHLGGSSTQSRRVTVENRIGARTGDLVELALPGHAELKVSLLVWVVPLVGLVGGAILGSLTLQPFGFSQDPAVLVGAVVGFAAAFLLLRRVDASMAQKRELVPYIHRVVEACSPSTDGLHHNVS